MKGQFVDKVVLVTGGAKGIGKGIAKSFAKEGANVVIADVNETEGLNSAEEIQNEGFKCSFIKCDLSIVTEIQSLMKEVDNKFSAIHVVINNAGISKWNDPLTLSETDWDYVISTNLKSVFFASREAAIMMKKYHIQGKIINIASTRAIMSEKNSEAYAAAKGGIIALTHALAASFSDYNITVNAISPGWIETGDYNLLRDKDHQQHFSNRVGRPEDIARACLYLAHDNNNFVNGTNLVIDGGMTRKMIYEE